MKKLIGRVALLVVVAATVGMLLSPQASAGDLYWDVNGPTAGTGGTGAWNTSSNFWSDQANSVWGPWFPNDCTTIAYFGGTAGTVTLGSADIGADMLVFQTTGYSIATSVNKLWLGGEANIVATSGVTATIIQPLTGSSGLNKLDCSTLSLTNSGTVILSGLNTYTGSTTIGSGILQLGANNVLPDATVVNVLTGGTLNVNTRTDTIAGLSLQGGSITGAAGGILTNNTVAYDMQSGSVSAILAGNKGMNKTTAGTVTLSGVNTYSGTTNISAGTLTVGATNGLSANSNFVISGTGTLAIGTFSANIGGLSLQSGGTITGTTGTLVNNSATPYDMQVGTVPIILAGSAGLNKTTAGTVTLSKANTYTGLTNITEGTLVYGIANAISTGAVTVNGPTAVLNIGSYLDSVGTVTVDGGGLITGAGTLTVGALELKSGTISAIIGGGTWAGFNKTTDGTVLLTGVNTIANTSAAPVVSAGTLLIGANSLSGVAGALGTGTTVYLGDTRTTTNNSNPALLTNGNFTIGKAITTGPTAMIGTTGTITIGGNQDCVSTFSGAITLWSPSGLRISQVATTGSNALNITGGIAPNSYAPFAGATLQNQMGGLPAPTITFAGPGAIIVSGGVIANGGGYATTNVSVTGGTTTFRSVNTYTGLTTINSGATLALGINNAINSASAITVNGGTLAMADCSTAVTAISLQNGGSITGTTGIMTNNTNAYDMQSGTVTARLAGNKGLNKTTGGLVTLTNANTYTGTTSVTGGTLKLDFSATGAAATNIIPAADCLTLSGANLLVVGNASGDDCQTFAATALNVGASTVQFTNSNGTGTPTVALKTITRNTGGTVDFTLPSLGAITTTTANTDFTLTGGQQTILGGWATVGGADWAVAGGSSPFTIAALATYSATWVAGTDVDTPGADPGSAMDINSLRYTSGGTTTLPGTLNIASGGLLVTPAAGAVIVNSGTLTSANGELIVTQNSLSTMTINSAVADCGSTPVALTKSGAGNLLLGSANSYTGNTYVDCGTLTLGAAGALPSTTSVVVNQGTLALNGNSPTVAGLSLQNDGAVSGSGTVTSATAYDIQSGTISSALAGNVAFNKTTNGTVTLNTAATYTGATSVAGGTLAMGAANVLPSTTTVTVNGGTLAMGNNQNQSVAGVSLKGNGQITGTGTSTLTSGSTFDIQSGTVNVVLTGTAGLTKTTNGFLFLNTPATYTGPTTLVGFDGGYNWMGGMLLPGVNDALPATTDLTVEAGAVLNLGNFNQTVQSVSLKNGGQLLAYANAGGVGILTSKTAYDLQDGTISAVLADCGSTPIGLTKTGSGKVLLMYNNSTFTGPILVANGILQLTSAGLPGTTTLNTIGSSVTPPTVTLGDASTAANNYSATLMSTGGFKNPIVVSANATGGGYFIGSDATPLFQVNNVPAVTVNSPVTIAKLVPYVGTATTYIMEFQTGTGGGGGITSGNAGLKTVTAYSVTNGVKFSNIISDGGGGTLGMLFAGGVHEMNNAASSYSGPSIVQSGRVLADVNAPSGANGAFGNSTDPIYLGNAATAANNYSAGLLTNNAVTVGRQVLVTDNATAGTYTLGGNKAAASTFSGLITLDQPVTIRQEIGAGNALNITGGITGGNAGAKAVTFSSPDCATNPAQIAVKTNPITDGAGQLSVVVANAGNNGVVTFSAANTYTGSTTVNLGTLKLDFSATGAAATQIINPGNTMAMGGGILSVVGNATGDDCQTFGTTGINAGASSIQFTNTVATGTPTVALGGITRNADATVDFTLPAAGAITTPTVNTDFTSQGGQQSILGGWATIAGANWAVSAGDGINPGAIAALAADCATFTANKDIAPTAAGTVPGAAMSINSLRYNSAVTYATALPGTLNVASGGILMTPTSGAVTISGSTLTSGSGELVVIQNHTTNAMTISSVIDDCATGAAPVSVSLTKSGLGNLNLTTVNTYTGATTLNGGTLTLGIAYALPATPLTVNGGTLAMGANNDCVTSFTLMNGSVTGTGRLASQSDFAVQNGAVSAILTDCDTTPIGLNKTTNGTVTLSGANTYTGPTNVAAGTLIVSALQGNGKTYNITGNGIGSGFGSVNTGPALVTDSVLRLGIASPWGTTASTAAKININGGALEMMALGLTADCITLQGNGVITGTGASALTVNNFYAYSGSLVGVGLKATNFYKLGPGSVTSWTGLAGGTATLEVDCGLFTCYPGVVFLVNSKYVLNGGTVALWGNNGFSSNSQTVGYPLWINGGTLDMKGYCQTFDCVSLYSGSITGPGTLSSISALPFDVRSGYVSAVLAGTAGLNKSTSGTVTLDGLQAYMGPTNVTGGTLLVNGNLFGSSTVNVSGDAILGGSGVISGDVSVNWGNVSPGNSAGTLTVKSLVFSGGSDGYLVDIAGVASYDNVIFKTSLNLAADCVTGVNLILNDTAYASVQQPGDKFWIFDGDTGSSPVANLLAFDNVNLPEGASFVSAGGVTYTVRYNAAGDPLGSGNNVLLTTGGVIPEPTTLLLLGTGVLGFFGYIRRRQMR